MAEEEKPAEDAEAQGPKQRSKLMLIAGGAAALLLIAGGGTFFVLRKGDAPVEEGSEHAATEEPAGEHAAEAPAEPGAEHEEAAPTEHAEETAAEGGEHGGAPAPQFVSIDSFVVNINDGERDRFLKLKIDLEVSNAEVSKELEQRMPQVKDIMIGLLSSQTFAVIRSMEGKDQLREQVLTRINAVVRTGVVKQVLFTEFVVQ